MNKTAKNRNLLKIGAVLMLAFAWAIMPFVLNDTIVEANDEIRIRASLTGAAINGVTPFGYAEHRTDTTSGRRKLEVQVTPVNLPNGTALDVYLGTTLIGQVFINNNFGFVEFDTNNGQSVPPATNGVAVALRQGANDVMNGTLGIVNPTPSPSVSPTGSPNPSPSVSPTSSPNPSPSVTPTGSPSPSPSPNGGDLFAVLSGATINGVLPTGYAQYEIHSSRRELEIEVYQVALPAGTALTVTVDNTAVGQLFIESDNRGKLRLRTDNGQNVPTVVNGSTIVLTNGSATVLSGTFVGASPSPSPSPSVSPSPSPSVDPSPSPSVSPSPSPSASPTPALGRYFEAQTTGSQMIPPVTTGATGEIKVLLNQAETEATISGEFHNLSSAQTTAKIFLTAGDTSVIYEFGVIGGTNGNFANATIPVNALQVAQLRAGAWFSVIGSANNPSGEIGGRLRTHSVSSDFDGDGRDDQAVFRPSAGTWYAQNSLGFTAQVFGGANDKLVSGDYDGDGRTDAAVFRNQNGIGVWDVKRSSDGGVTTKAFGFATDIAQRGDFDGDGRQDLAVYRPSNGTWYIQKSSTGAILGVNFGASEDKAMATDLDGDGKTDIAVFRPSNGTWYWLKSSDGGFSAAAFGQAGDVPIAGDFDGDGKSDLSVFRPSNGVWYIWRSSNGTFDFRQFGLGDDIPVAGNYDGDNKTDIAVFRPSTGIWYIWRSLDNSYDYRYFGQAGDVPTSVR